MKSRIEQRSAIREKQITKWSKLEAEVTVEQNKKSSRREKDKQRRPEKGSSKKYEKSENQIREK